MGLRQVGFHRVALLGFQLQLHLAEEQDERAMPLRLPAVSRLSLATELHSVAAIPVQVAMGTTVVTSCFAHACRDRSVCTVDHVLVIPSGPSSPLPKPLSMLTSLPSPSVLASDHQFTDGEQVAVVGLPSTARNGRRGPVSGPPDAAGRIPVLLSAGRLLVVSPTTIALVSSSVAVEALASCAAAKANLEARRWTMPPLHDLF